MSDRGTATMPAEQTAAARSLLEEAWRTIVFTRQPDDAKAVSENRLLARIEEWLRV